MTTIKTQHLGVLLMLVMAVLVAAPAARAETTTDPAALQATIATLMAQIADLQAQLQAARGELSTALKDGLVQGMTDEDIAEIQSLLATDPEIYPEGITSGYFGPLTEQALKRFQTQNGLAVTGAIDTDTKAYLEEYLSKKEEDPSVRGRLFSLDVRNEVHQRIMNKRAELLDKKQQQCDEKSAAAGLCGSIGQRMEEIKVRQDRAEELDTAITDKNAELADGAIARAEDAIERLTELLDSLSKDTPKADALLNDAEDLLAKAKTKYDDGQYYKARWYANRALTVSVAVEKAVRSVVGDQEVEDFNDSYEPQDDVEADEGSDDAATEESTSDETTDGDTTTEDTTADDTTDDDPSMEDATADDEADGTTDEDTTS